MYLSLDAGRPGVIDMDPSPFTPEPGPVFEILGMTVYYNDFWVDYDTHIERYDDCLYYNDMLWGKISILENFDGDTTQIVPEKFKTDNLRICRNVFWKVFGETTPKDVEDKEIVYRYTFSFDEWHIEKSHNWEWIVLEKHHENK